jgi:hypothetical protein
VELPCPLLPRVDRTIQLSTAVVVVAVVVVVVGVAK